MQRLADRLRLTRVCCGDWIRVCQSRSVTTRLGLTGIFLDPPYDADLLSAAAAALARSGALAPDARIYLERRARDELPALPEAWKELRAGRAGEVGYHLFAT